MIDLVKTKTRPCRYIYYDIEILRPENHDIMVPRPKNQDIDIGVLKHHDIKKQRQLSHDIVIPRNFFREQKTTKSSFYGILTLMPLILLTHGWEKILKHPSAFAG